MTAMAVVGRTDLVTLTVRRVAQRYASSHRLVLIEPLTKNEPQRWLGGLLGLIFGKPARNRAKADCLEWQSLRYRRRRESVLSRRSTNQRTTPVSEPTVAEATESIYASLQANNADIDAHIATLKAALAREGLKQAVFNPTRLVQNNRSGRKLMQAYFRQRGVSVSFSE